MTFAVVNPCVEPAWDERLPESGACSFFHSRAWAATLTAAYGYTPRYFTLHDHGTLQAVMPFMEVNSLLTGRRGVSLPFSDVCPPVLRNGSPAPDVVGAVVDCAAQWNWRYVEWRQGGGLLSPHLPYETYVVHSIPLCGGEAEANRRLRGSTRRNIARAQAAVDVQVSTSRAAVDAFYALQVITRKHHGVPPQPKRFFDCVYEHVIAPGYGVVVLGVYEGRPIAANVYFHFRRQALYKYGASDRRFQHLRASDLVMWEAIKWCLREGFETLNLGRTSLSNAGLLQFKHGWGAESELVHYHRYSLARGCFVPGRGESDRLQAVFRHLPLCVLKTIGALLYPHMG
jgi:hypothetical protein